MGIAKFTTQSISNQLLTKAAARSEAHLQSLRWQLKESSQDKWPGFPQLIDSEPQLVTSVSDWKK